ncbi:MAG: DUF2065 domain-containing protein [Gammaproteobacteria bacterium]|nr:DUF2065 domain-containing protein [Gammaproteobacteria bacterium]
MAWGDLLAALALYLVIEGLLPFVSPDLWRKSLQSIADLPDGRIRAIGLGVIVAGLALLVAVRASGGQ